MSLRAIPLDDEFMALRSDRSGGSGACWPWKLSLATTGYGQITSYASGRRRQLKAHRVALEISLGRPVVGLVCHRCDNPPCVNPAHLYEGTNSDNLRDMYDRGLRPRKLSAADALAIATELRSNPPRGAGVRLAKKYGLSPNMITQISKGKVYVRATSQVRT